MQILKSQKLLLKVTKRNFFGLFKKKKEAEIITRQFDDEEVQKMSEFQDPHRNLTQAEKHYLELRKQREEEEAQKLEEQRLLEEANVAYQREEETTIKYLDYRAVMINNQKILPQKEFLNLDHLLDFMSKFNYDKQLLTEENFLKIFKAFNHFSSEIDETALQSPFYQKFLEHIKKYVYTFHSSETLVELSRFLDIYCVDYPELYVKFQRQIIKKIDHLSVEEVIIMVIGLSNQGEGEEEFFDKIETKLLVNIEVLTTEQIVDILQSFFNVQTGTKFFINKLLKKLIEKLENKYLRPELKQLLVVVNMMAFLQDDILKDDREKLWQLCEQRILNDQEFLNFRLSCKFARAFGQDNGSEKLFKVLLKYAIKETKDFKQMNEEQFELFLEGFVFTYRIDNQSFEIVKQKFDFMQSQLSPKHFACLAKALYMYSQEDSPLVQKIESILLEIITGNIQVLTKTDIYHILQSYLVTRMGSRQFYRLLEYNLPRVLQKHLEDKEFLATVKLMYEKSALCSLDFLRKLQKLIEIDVSNS